MRYWPFTSHNSLRKQVLATPRPGLAQGLAGLLIASRWGQGQHSQPCHWGPGLGSECCWMWLSSAFTPFDSELWAGPYWKCMNTRRPGHPLIAQHPLFWLSTWQLWTPGGECLDAFLPYTPLSSVYFPLSQSRPWSGPGAAEFRDTFLDLGLAPIHVTSLCLNYTEDVSVPL